MNIVTENRDDLTTLIKVTVGEADYGQAVDKALHDYKRKANIPGFRPGMVPMGLINKMYRKGTVAEESYRTASKACFDYLEKEKIDYVGDVLPAEEQQPFDFDKNTEHEFMFEIGLAPKVEIDLGAKDKVNRYKIRIAKDMHDGYRKNFLNRFGRLVDVEKVEDDEALIGTLSNGELTVDEAYIGLVSMTEEERKPYVGVKAGDVLDVNIEELYKNVNQRASMLKMKEDEVTALAPEFKFTVEKVRKYAEPEMDEEFFKNAFPQGEVTDEAGLDAYIDEQIARDLSREGEYLFNFELKNLLMKKAGLKLPEGFIKRWLFTINEGKFTMEEIEKDFDKFLEMMKWNVIQKHYVDTLGIKVEQEDVTNEAKALAAAQFAQYGMANVGDELLSHYAKSMLENKQEANKIVEKLYERKVLDALAGQVKVEEKEVSAEDFNKVAQAVLG